jgi:hypothetical protein
MHSAEYRGFQFLYNGDYSGHIKVTDNKGFEWPPMDFDRMVVIITDPEAQTMHHVLAFRDFVADAIRRESISVLEQMDTEQIFNSPIGKVVLEDYQKEHFD